MLLSVLLKAFGVKPDDALNLPEFTWVKEILDEKDKQIERLLRLTKDYETMGCRQNKLINCLREEVNQLKG